MKSTQAVGIDLGTTYSCIAWLNEHGQPVTIPNQEGELATPSVVFFDDDQPIVGTEALRNSIAHPDRVVQHAKRFMGDAKKYWTISGTQYSPFHISGMIIRKLVSAAQEKIGEIREAVITVPAQFSDAQRHATMLAGHAAGLEKIEMINEPVAAALCYVLGNEGLAFTELAIDQQLLVYDLGGGTLDLAVVRYSSDQVRVVAADGDLQLGGLDWTRILIDMAAEDFIADFGEDPREDRESLQFLALEAEQAKRSLSVRPRAAITVQHGRHRRTYQIEQAEFERRCQPLVERAEAVTRRILSSNRMGWAHIDVVLTTGGASRMPMIRDSLKKLSGRTLNTSLSPDQSIAHGAACYAGMLLSNQQYTRTIFNSQTSSRLARVRQQSVSARDLGILIRNTQTGQREPHYLIPANSPLPAAQTHVFGTVVAGQTRVHVQIVESGAGPQLPPTVLGACRITELPSGLPEGSEVEVTISYDRQARVHVSARELHSGKWAEAEIIRQENLDSQLEQQPPAAASPSSAPVPAPVRASAPPAAARVAPPTADPAPIGASTDPELNSLPEDRHWFELSDLIKAIDGQAESEPPVPVCHSCGGFLNRSGECPKCSTRTAGKLRAKPQSAAGRPIGSGPATRKKAAGSTENPPRPTAANPGTTGKRPKRPASAPPPPDVKPKKKGASPRQPPASRRKPIDPAEAEFWDMVDGD